MRVRLDAERALDLVTLTPAPTLTQERDVVRLRHGFDDGQPKSWQTVANMVGVDLQRVRSVEKTAMGRLRKPLYMKRLEHFERVPLSELRNSR